MSQSIFLIAVVSVVIGAVYGAVRSTQTPTNDISWRKQPPLLRKPGASK